MEKEDKMRAALDAAYDLLQELLRVCADNDSAEMIDQVCLQIAEARLYK